MEKKKVIILGGGIGGLSAAYALSKRTDEFDITIIEKNNYLGGQATENIYKTKDDASLVCWHVISSRHKFLLGIMEELIGEDGEKISSHLKIINKIIYCLKNRNYTEYDDSFIANELKTFNSAFENIYGRKISKKDRYILYKIYTYSSMISEERLITYDTILWKVYIKNLSDDVKQWILYFTSIYLGIDCNKVSAYYMFRLIRNIKAYDKKNQTTKFYVFDGPISTILFDPWKKCLEERGVKILLNHSVDHIYHTNMLSTISTINVKYNNKDIIFTSDIFINALDSKNLSKLYPISNRFTELYENSKFVQTKILYHIPFRLRSINITTTVLVLPNAPWFLLVRIVEDLWDSEKHDYLLCGIGIWDAPGLNGKKAINCTREELAEECWNQINTNYDIIIQKTIPKWSIWDSFEFDIEINEEDTDEPRFNNNINIQNLRPDYIDKHLTNFYHATSYAKTNTNIYNMESAVEAGIKTSNIICKKQDKISQKKNVQNLPKFSKIPVTNAMKVCRFIDKYLFLMSKYIDKDK